MIEPLAKEFEEYKQKLLEHQAKRGITHSEDDYVFPSRINNGFASKTFYKYYHEILEAADLTDINFHTLRHTFATMCLESDIDIFTISKISGHASVKINGDVYLHMSQSHQKNMPGSANLRLYLEPPSVDSVLMGSAFHKIAGKTPSNYPKFVGAAKQLISR